MHDDVPAANPPASSSKEDELERLRQELEEVRKRERALVRERDLLRRENEELKEKLQALERAAMRQAAPFRIPDEKRSKAPRPPGRKQGHAGVSRRIPEMVDETVEAPMTGCPRCGGSVKGVRPVVQYIEDVPKPRPHVLKIVTYAGRCRRCGSVSTRHPRQMSLARGAAAVQIGPNALGIAVDLNKRLGLPMRRTCDVLAEHFALRVTPGAVVHAEARLANRLQPAYLRIRRWLRTSSNVCSDETSWWVNGPGHWLWVFTSREGTLFRVDSKRRRSVVTEVLGNRFRGVLSSDCLNIYNKVKAIQHKCYAHHLRAIRKATETPLGETESLRDLRVLLQTAIALGKARGEISSADYEDHIVAIEKQADELLVKATADPAAEGVAQRLLRQRAHLFTFLKHPGVDATNNAAERALRPAVVARKMSCGNRTDRGRNTWQVLSSISATAEQRRSSFASLIATAAPTGANHSLDDLLLKARR